MQCFFFFFYLIILSVYVLYVFQCCRLQGIHHYDEQNPSNPLVSNITKNNNFNGVNNQASPYPASFHRNPVSIIVEKTCYVPQLRLIALHIQVFLFVNLTDDFCCQYLDLYMQVLTWPRIETGFSSGQLVTPKRPKLFPPRNNHIHISNSHAACNSRWSLIFSITST